MTLQDQIAFITGPLTPIGTTWFDQTLVTKAKTHGDACPVAPPADAGSSAFNDFELLQYYDLPLSEYIAYCRTGDTYHLNNARKAADAQWKHPYIGEGKTRLWPDSVSPAPRMAGVMGMLCRAIDGRPEMFDWLTAYSQFHLNHWCKSRVTSNVLFYGVREGAFALHFATVLAKCLPDAYPVGTASTGNGAQIRSQLLADIENVAVNYYGRLQLSDGSWRWDDPDYTDADGGNLRGVTQPFMVGLLLCALADVHQLVPKDSIKNSILNGAKHLYSVTYRKDEVVTGWPEKKWRSFWYFYHGGTSVNPTKYEKGGGSYTNTSEGQWVVGSERQGIAIILPAVAYAFNISRDPFFESAAKELWDAAYSGNDGIRNEMAGTAKNFNQNVRRGSSYFAWMSASPTPNPPDPIPVPPIVTLKKVAWPKTEAKQDAVLAEQWTLGFRMKRNLTGDYAEFEKVK